LRPHEEQDELSKYLYGKLSKETQALVTGQADSRTLAARWRRISTAFWTGRRFIRRSGSRTSRCRR
jgi:hypothetical protein